MNSDVKIYTEEKIIEIAMEIILTAGDGRTCTQEALKAAKVGDFTTAAAKIEEAHANICKAHGAQTELVTSETSEESKINPPLLLIHAQDTLMTIMTEINLAKEMIDILRMMYEKGVL